MVVASLSVADVGAGDLSLIRGSARDEFSLTAGARPSATREAEPMKLN
jgi:hypothetical protein